jgi:hypothetical protein
VITMEDEQCYSESFRDDEALRLIMCRRENKDFPKLPSATSLIREMLKRKCDNRAVCAMYRFTYV